MRRAEYLSRLVATASSKWERSGYIDGARRERELARGDSQQARYYVDQIKSLGSNLQSYRNALDNARSEFDNAKRVSDPLKADFDAARTRTQAARAEFDRLKQVSDAAGRAHDAAREAFNKAKAESERAKAAFNKKLEQLKGSDWFERSLPDGTTVYGPKSTEGHPGHKHGHRGNDFDRSPHSTIGSAASDIARGKNQPGHTQREHPTKRW